MIKSLQEHIDSCNPPDGIVGGTVSATLFNFKLGYPKFLKLFMMNKEELVKTLTDLIGHLVPSHLLENPSITKIIDDDYANKIKIVRFDSLRIDPTGIYARLGFSEEYKLLMTLSSINLESIT